MNDLVAYLVNNEFGFIFILVRVSAFMTAIPFLDGTMIPTNIKVMMALSVSLLLLPLVHLSLPPVELVPLALGLLGEVVTGLAIALGVKLLFSAIELGAELSGLQMGFGIANLYNPLSGQTDSVTGRLVSMLAVLVFFGISGHHILIRALAESFAIVPVSGFIPSGALVKNLIDLFGKMFLLGMKIAVPVTLALLLANGALGFLSRMVPQINLFVTSFVITIGLGLVIFGATLSLTIHLARGEMEGLDRIILSLLHEMKGS